MTLTLLAFIGLVWLREQIVHGGGPEWLDMDFDAPNANNNNNNVANANGNAANAVGGNNPQQPIQQPQLPPQHPPLAERDDMLGRLHDAAGDAVNANQDGDNVHRREAGAHFNEEGMEAALNANNNARRDVIGNWRQANDDDDQPNLPEEPDPPEILDPPAAGANPVDPQVDPAVGDRQFAGAVEPNVNNLGVGGGNDIGDGAGDQWNPMEWDRAAEELTWERLLGLDGSLVFLEHVFWVVSLNTLFILVFGELHYVLPY